MILSLFLLLSLIPLISSSKCSLDYIRVENESFNSASLTWKGPPCEPGSLIEIKHLLWLSCPKDVSSNIPAVSQELPNVGDDPSVSLSGLVPYSLYQVSFGGREARFRTEPDIPDVRPELLAIQPGKQSFHLEWRRTKATSDDCPLQNGLLGGYRVELWGLSPWVLNNASEPLKAVNVGDNIYEYYFHELLPYTTYSLRVYARNQGVREVNPGVFLKVKGTTLPTRPQPPSSLRIKPMNRSVFLEWDPEYPPSGEVEFYYINLRETETNIIKKGYYVHKIDDRPTCPGERSEDSQCWVISYKDIDFNIKYSLTLRTKNIGIDEQSRDSESFEFIIPSNTEVPEFVTQENGWNSRVDKDENVDDDFHYYHTVTLVVLAVLGAAITILLVIIIALVFKIKRNKLKTANSPYETHELSAHYRRGSSSTHFTSIGYGSSFVNRLNDIQSRCLPDPPSQQEKQSETPLKDPSNYSRCVEDAPDETYLNVSQKPASISRDLDVDGYLTPSFIRKGELSHPVARRFSKSMGQLSSEKIQIRSYDRVWPPLSASQENPSNCNYIDLENVIHQSVEDLIRSKTSSVV